MEVMATIVSIETTMFVDSGSGMCRRVGCAVNEIVDCRAASGTRTAVATVPVTIRVLAVMPSRRLVNVHVGFSTIPSDHSGICIKTPVYLFGEGTLIVNRGD